MKKNPLVHLSSNLRSLRKKHGYTIREVESHTGISNPYLCHLENPDIETNPSVSIVLTLAKFYQVSLTKLLGIK